MNGRTWIALTALAFASCGCVEIEQEIHVNHDGSGKIVEKIALSPRGARMAEAAAREGRGGADASALFSESAAQERAKAMGEVKLESRQETKLPDGRRQLQIVYTFKDLNNVTLWVMPTLSYKRDVNKELRARLDGSIRFRFRPRYEEFGRIWQETVNVGATWPRDRDLVAQPLMSPAERQEFARVLPIFLDMAQDLRLSVVLIAPIEEFEEPRDMLWVLKADKNRVPLFTVDGRGLAQAVPGMLQLLTNEVVDADALMNVPGIYAPNGGVVRFMKSSPAQEGSLERMDNAGDRTAATQPGGAEDTPTSGGTTSREPG